MWPACTMLERELYGNVKGPEDDTFYHCVYSDCIGGEQVGQDMIVKYCYYLFEVVICLPSE